MDEHTPVPEIKQVAESLHVETLRKLAQLAIDDTHVAQRSMDEGEYYGSSYGFTQARFELQAAREKLEHLIASLPVA